MRRFEISADRPLEVVWYTFGVHHVVRTEDAFFDRSPALDVPPSPHVGDDSHLPLTRVTTDRASADRW